MKVLVASLGNSLDSYIAKRFEHAAWYLMVDTETFTAEATRHATPQDRRRVVLTAVQDGAVVCVAGKFADSSRKLLRTGGMRLALIHGVPGRAAVDRMRSGRIALVDPDFTHGNKDAPGGRNSRTPMAAGKRGVTRPGVFHASGSPRGHHHLQQYGGRGH